MTQKRSRGRRSRRRIALWTILGLIALFVLIQFVPYGRDHANKPETNPFTWTSPQAEAIAKLSCYDCHSNQTKWWRAVKLAPFSWLAQHDIDGAQEVFSFSEWAGSLTTEELREAINESMPPLQFTLLHPNAKLSEADKQTLMDGFRASLAGNGSAGTTTPTPAPAATSSGADAVAIIGSSCSSCHPADNALQFRASSTAEAQALIDQMIQNGATITAAEEQTLIDYFTR